jgi:hypothetical protein
MAPPILLGLAMAFIGNWVIAQPTVALDAASLWSVLEASVPPAAVLFMAIIGERLILTAIKHRHANERAYQRALVEWKAATAEPEHSPRWRTSYANALKETLRAVNSKGQGSTARREFMATMRGADWSAVVWRELLADEWLDDAAPFVASRPAMAASGSAMQASQDRIETQEMTPVTVPPVVTTGNGNQAG